MVAPSKMSQEGLNLRQVLHQLEQLQLAVAPHVECHAPGALAYGEASSSVERLATHAVSHLHSQPKLGALSVGSRHSSVPIQLSQVNGRRGSAFVAGCGFSCWFFFPVPPSFSPHNGARESSRDVPKLFPMKGKAPAVATHFDGASHM